MPGPDHVISAPSDWVRRFAPLIAPKGRVVDIACGRGRNARHLSDLGFNVVAVDRDRQALESLRGFDRIEAVVADLESNPWPFSPGTFDAVVVTNYLWRPLMPQLSAALRDGGVLIYETFAVGNEKYGRPANPDFLLHRNELIEWLVPQLSVVAFEQGIVSRPAPAVVQRICAVREPHGWTALEPDRSAVD